MKVRRLNTDGDIVFGYGKSTIQQDSPEAVATVLQMRIQMLLGDWEFNVGAGTNLWLEEMSKEGIDSVLRERILETQDVIDILYFESEHNPQTRKYTATIKVSTTYGDIETEVSL